jgi:type III restriction enzyme
MATGSGKTVVMAMLIAWQTINKVAHPRDARFTKRFLVVTPGHHDPRPAAGDPAERRRQLLPRARPRAADLWPHCCRRRSSSRTTTPSCPRTPRRSGRRANTRKILTAGQEGPDPFVETPDEQMVSRVLRDLGGRRRGKGARSSCSTTRPTTATGTSRTRGGEDAARSRRGGRSAQRGGPRLVQGLQAVARRRSASRRLRPVGHAVLPEGLGLQRGLHLPVGRQRLLADGRHRVGHRQGAPHPGRRRRHERRLVTYLRLWDHVGTKLPKKPRARRRPTPSTGPPDTSSRARCAACTAATRSVRPVGGHPPAASRRR